MHNILKINKQLRPLAAVMLLVAGGLLAGAQTHYKAHVSVGGHAGMAMSEMSFSPSVDQSWKNGVLIGAHIRYQEEKLFGLIGEINFVQRGWKERFDDNTLSYSRTLTYITVPLMTHISFGSNRFKGFVNLGPEFGFNIADSRSANFDYDNPLASGVPENRQTEQMYAPLSGHFDYGITAGLGCEYYVRPRHSLMFEVRFYYGLGNIFPSSKADTFSASRCMTLAATLGYSFRLR